jgi:hypothetical protein
MNDDYLQAKIPELIQVLWNDGYPTTSLLVEKLFSRFLELKNAVRSLDQQVARDVSGGTGA